MNSIRIRLTIAYFLCMLAFGFLVYRLFVVQYLNSDVAREKASMQHIRTIPIPSERGAILTESGEVLATSMKVYQIFGEVAALRPDPNSKRDRREERLNRMLEEFSTILELDVDKLRSEILQGDNPFVRIASNVTKSDADLIRDLIRNREYTGVSIEETSKRFYPYHSLSAPTIGMVNSQEQGFLGIEAFYNTLLKGEDGEVRMTADVHGKPLPYGIHERREPRHGADVVLTLHPQFQYFVEQRLEEAVRETGAKSAAAVLIDVNSGEVYAMANSPTFDLNHPFDLDDAILPDNWEQLSDQEQTNYYFNRVWNNPIVSNIYEPGSTMKTLISAIAVNEGLVNLNSSFYCEGSTRVTGEQLRCFSYPIGHGHQDLTTAFVNSCNVAYIDIGQRIGKERLYQYFEKVGLFSPSGVDLPAESMPNYLDVSGLRDVELATMSYGHTIGVNMLQVVSALSSTVNGGYRVHPHFLKEIRYPDGRSEYPPLPNRERIFERETVETVKSMLQAMANHLKPTLEVEGIALGGKTGTSVKFIDGEYRDDQVISSFVVFAPIDQPKYALLILLDEPDIQAHGHRVAVQFADRILEDLFRYEALSASSSDRETVIVPNVVGLTLAEAREALKSSGLQMSADMQQQLDTRVVDEQFPIAGVPVPQGALIILKLKEGL